VLVPGGRLLLIDWSESFGGMGPAPHHVFEKQTAQELIARTGLSIVSESIPSGEHHYALLAKK
jgi:hypothetical protein